MHFFHLHFDFIGILILLIKILIMGVATFFATHLFKLALAKSREIIAKRKGDPVVWIQIMWWHLSILMAFLGILGVALAGLMGFLVTGHLFHFVTMESKGSAYDAISLLVLGVVFFFTMWRQSIPRMLGVK